MEIQFSLLLTLLNESFDGGNNAIQKKDKCIDSILLKYNIKEEDDDKVLFPKDEGFRIYSVDELKLFPIGTVFIHEFCGRCRINKEGEEKFISFDNDFKSAGLVASNEYPWNLPMRLVTEEPHDLIE